MVPGRQPARLPMHLSPTRLTLLTLAILLLPPAAYPIGHNEPSAGRLLVARSQLLDPNFARSVVLLVAYGAEGAFGLVVNRPSRVEVAKAIPELKLPRADLERVHVGGPVQRQQVSLLLDAEHQLPGSEHVFNSVYFSSRRETIEAISGSVDGVRRYRVFSGYSGWAAGQLGAELERGDWTVAPARSEDVFTRDGEGLWKELERRYAGVWVRADPPRSAVFAFHANTRLELTRFVAHPKQHGLAAYGAVLDIFVVPFTGIHRGRVGLPAVGAGKR